MLEHNKHPVKRRSVVQGRGVLNTLINKLPFELHLPGYQFCGPGTRLSRRLSLQQKGINPLDAACREHDIAYSESKDTKVRNQADLKLAEAAWRRVKAKDATFGEKANAWVVTNTMKAKAKLGMGLKQQKTNKGRKKTGVSRNKPRKQNVLRRMMSNAKCAVKSRKPDNLKSAIKIALAEAKKGVKDPGAVTRKPLTRVIPVPKTGGVLPFLVPLFAGLSALGALGGGTAGIIKAVNASRDAQKQLSEHERHNKMMESIALGKGLYLKPYKKGLGLYLKPKN